jgi:phage terminase large subunit
MGAPTMKLALSRSNAGRMITVPYHGSAAVLNPDDIYSGDKGSAMSKTNSDAFANYRSQTWTWLRDRFHATYVAITRASKGMIVNASSEDLISISTDCEDWQQLQAELSRPKRIYSKNGKILVESKKEMRSRGVDSPNLADSLVMANAARKTEVKVTDRIIYNEFEPLDSGMGF